VRINAVGTALVKLRVICQAALALIQELAAADDGEIGKVAYTDNQDLASVVVPGLLGLSSVIITAPRVLPFGGCHAVVQVDCMS